jgi:hypothetical protein
VGGNQRHNEHAQDGKSAMGEIDDPHHAERQRMQSAPNNRRAEFITGYALHKIVHQQKLVGRRTLFCHADAMRIISFCMASFFAFKLCLIFVALLARQ